jgi:hypothetical protein
VADYGAAIGNVVTSTVTLGHVKIAAPYCGFGWASDVGTVFGTLALGVLGGGAGAAGEVADGTATVEEVEAGAQAAEAVETASRPSSVFWSGGKGAMDAASDYATSTGGVTLEMTSTGQALEVATQGMDYGLFGNERGQQPDLR